MLRILCLFLVVSSIQAKLCVQRKLEFGNVCVCNETYCDTIPPIGTLSASDIKIYWTSDDVSGFTVRELTFTNNIEPSIISIEVNPAITYQKIIGIGGAFTDSGGYNINLLPEGARRKLMESYFSEDGIEYNMARVPIGGVDFSPSWYTLDDSDVDDMELKHFALNKEDLNHKIPFIKEAAALRKGKQLELVASAWIIPHWMLHEPGYTIVKDTHYQVYADYYKRFFDEYRKHDIKFWGVTTGNEPMNGFGEYRYVQGVAWLPPHQAKWITENLVPTLNTSDYKNLKILLHDDSSYTLPFSTHPIINDGKTLDYIDGVAVHWYDDGSVPLEIIDLIKTPKKDLILLHSESCFFITRPFLGDWGRASSYVDTVMNHLELGYNGWIDWNLAVNFSGGPNNLNWGADAPCIISQDHKEFYKQPYFYAIGHFSKFVIPGSVRIHVSLGNTNDLKAVAFKRPDNLYVIILYNRNTQTAFEVQLRDKNRYSERIEVPAASVQSILFTV